MSGRTGRVQGGNAYGRDVVGGGVKRLGQRCGVGSGGRKGRRRGAAVRTAGGRE